MLQSQTFGDELGQVVLDVSGTSSQPFFARPPAMRVPGAPILGPEPSSTGGGPVNQSLYGLETVALTGRSVVSRIVGHVEPRSTGLSTQEPTALVRDLSAWRLRAGQPTGGTIGGRPAGELLSLAISSQQTRRVGRYATGMRPEIAIHESAREWAQSVDATGDVLNACKLCLRFVPGAEAVSVSLTRDPEEGSIGFHFAVRTVATPDGVVAAEDRLHEALFEAIAASTIALFSIGYVFH